MLIWQLKAKNTVAVKLERRIELGKSGHSQLEADKQILIFQEASVLAFGPVWLQDSVGVP